MTSMTKEELDALVDEEDLTPATRTSDFWDLPASLRDMLVYMLTSPTLMYKGQPISAIKTVVFPDKAVGPDLFKNFVDHCERESAFFPEDMYREDIEQECVRLGRDMVPGLLVNRRDFESAPPNSFNLSRGEKLYKRYFQEGGAFEFPGFWVLKLGGSFALGGFLKFMWIFQCVHRGLWNEAPKYVTQTFSAFLLIDILAAVMLLIAGGAYTAMGGAGVPLQWATGLSLFLRRPFYQMMLLSTAITFGIIVMLTPAKFIASVWWVFFG